MYIKDDLRYSILFQTFKGGGGGALYGKLVAELCWVATRHI